MVKKKKQKKYNKTYDNFILWIIWGLVSWIFVAVATEAARIARLNWYELLAQWLRVIVLIGALWFFVRQYIKNQ